MTSRVLLRHMLTAMAVPPPCGAECLLWVKSRREAGQRAVRYVPEADIAANPGTIYWPARMMRIGAPRLPGPSTIEASVSCPLTASGCCILGEEHYFFPTWEGVGFGRRLCCCSVC